MGKKTWVIIGGSGMIGSLCINFFRTVNPGKKIIALLRREPDWKSNCDTHLEYKIVNFDDPSTYEKYLQSLEGIICTIGTTIKKAGSKSAFKKVDYEYPFEIAKTARSKGCRKFLLVSAVGVHSNSPFFYNKVKGMLEDDLKQLAFDTTIIFRPSLLIGARKEFRLGEEIAKKLSPLFSTILPKSYKPTEAIHVAASIALMVDHKVQGVKTVDSHEMKSLYENALETKIIQK